MLFYPWATPQVPTVDQLKKDSFSPCEKMVSQMSLYLPLTAISYKMLVTGSGKKNQLFGTTDNLLTHFEWANADEEVFMCLWKEVSVIVARRVLFKRNIMPPIFWRWITSKIYFFLSSAYVKWNWLQTVLTESSCCHELLNSVNDSGVEKLNHFCPCFYVTSPQSAFKLSPTDWRFAFPFKFGFQKLIII